MRLVVVDSIAALFRAEFGPHQLTHRSELLRAFGAQLHRLSDRYSAAVVCINQVHTSYIFTDIALDLIFSGRNPIHVAMVAIIGN